MCGVIKQLLREKLLVDLATEADDTTFRCTLKTSAKLCQISQATPLNVVDSNNLSCNTSPSVVRGTSQPPGAAI